jgi:hypothetical protein
MCLFLLQHTKNFVLQARPKRKNLNVFFNGYFMMVIKNIFFKTAFFLLLDLLKVALADSD